MYSVILTPDDNGTILATCPDLPEVATFGEDEADAIGRAADAIEEALAARIDRRENIPAPTAARTRHRKVRSPIMKAAAPERRPVDLPPLTNAKVELYRAARAAGVSQAELARRLGWQGPQVDRLFDLNHPSTIAQLAQASRAIGKRLAVKIEDAA